MTSTPSTVFSRTNDFGPRRREAPGRSFIASRKAAASAAEQKGAENTNISVRVLSPGKDGDGPGMGPNAGRGKGYAPGTQRIHDVVAILRANDVSVVGFQEKPRLEDARSNWVSTGIYILEPDTFDRIPKDTAWSIERSFLATTAARISWVVVCRLKRVRPQLGQAT